MSAKIGLEVHVPLATDAKLYCPCPADPPDEPNTNLCPTCTGQPGARPQGVNQHALEQALQATRTLNCRIQDAAIIQRKHYVYPDLPNNYQRTSTPLGEHGEFWGLKITEVHMEEDPGAYDPDNRTVDLNRSGTPLVEIVTEPDLATPDAVDEWLAVLQLTLKRGGILRQGSELKADVNVSTNGGDRVEVKNVVGGKNAARAAQFEIQRQQEERANGREIPRETRHFEEDKGITRSSRRKETIGDYRYMPDPDLPTLPLAPIIEPLEDPPNTPKRLDQLQTEHDLDLGEAIALLEDPTLDALFQRLRERVPDGHAIEVALRRLRGELDYRDTTLQALNADPEPILDLAEAWHTDAITKHVFTRLLRNHLDGENIQTDLENETQTSVDLGGAIQTVLDNEPEAIQDYHEGNPDVLNYLVGQVMAQTQGRADAKQTRENLTKALDERA